MPSAEEPSYLFEVMPAESPTSGYSRDVDVLVSQLKENLRLSNLKSKQYHFRQTRSTPYKLPITTSSTMTTSNTLNINNNNISNTNATNLSSITSEAGNNNSNKKACDFCGLRAGSCNCRCPLQGLLRHRRFNRDCINSNSNRNNNTNNNNNSSQFVDLEDAYQQFQLLLQKGSLIKEAVKRLRTSRENVFDDDDFQINDEDDDEDDDDSIDVVVDVDEDSNDKNSLDFRDEADDVDEEEIEGNVFHHHHHLHHPHNHHLDRHPATAFQNRYLIKPMRKHRLRKNFYSDEVEDQENLPIEL